MDHGLEKRNSGPHFPLTSLVVYVTGYVTQISSKGLGPTLFKIKGVSKDNVIFSDQSLTLQIMKQAVTCQMTPQ